MFRTTCVLALGGALAPAGCGRLEPPSRSPSRLTAADVRLARETETIEAAVPRDATLDGLLRSNRVGEGSVVRAVDAARDVFDPRRIRAGQPYRLVRTLDGLLREFEYQIDSDSFLRIASDDGARPGALDALDARVLPYDKQTSVVAIDARIDAKHPSLIAAIDAAGETIPLAIDVAGIFGGDVDFRSELQPGDRLRLLFEKASRGGRFWNYGPILAASLSVGGRQLEAYRWVAPNGTPAYYDGQGRSLKRFFLKSPLKFEPRITSGFSRHRLHPIDRVVRAHLGVDYAAPAGSPVVAAANGTVVSVGVSGAGGKVIHLRHAAGFETYYMHLSAYAPGVRAGARVAQGQLIGRVGMTGAATGPHLDYRVKRDGAFVDPLAAHARQPPGDPIPAAQFTAYAATRDTRRARLLAAIVADAPRQKPDAVPAVRAK